MAGTKCWFCGGELRWESDFNYDEVFGDGDGVVAFLTCTNCGADVTFAHRNEEEEDGQAFN